ncbi:MAG: hypothetical protein O2992_11445 [Gemmatimonadetes bacterium]|nr:hypothetical protein [Gemmatimonadota bacterium]
MPSRGEVPPDVYERRVELDPAGVEAEQVRHYGDHARGGSPLEEPATRFAKRHERGQDRVVVGGDERVPIVLADLVVEAMPELTTFFA